MATFHFNLVSPEKLLFSGEVDQVDVPGSEGDFGVLAGHAPFVTTLRPGILTIYREDGDVARGGHWRLCGGRVQAGLTVLADMAVPVEDVDRDAFAVYVKEAEDAAAAARRRPAARQAQLRAAQLRRIAGGAARSSASLASRTSRIPSPRARRPAA